MNTVFVTAAASVLAFSGSIAHALMIDSFDLGSQGLSNSTNVDQGSAVSGIDDASTIGGSRRVYQFDVTGANAFNTAAATAAFGGSESASISNADGVNSSVDIIWDGTAIDANASVDAEGLGGADLLADGADSLLFYLPFADQPVTLAFTVWDMPGSGGDSATVSSVFTAAATPYEISYADFSGVDFGAVGALRLRITGPVAYDVRLDRIETNADSSLPPAGAPAPATLALLGAGLIGMRVFRRRRAA